MSLSNHKDFTYSREYVRKSSIVKKLMAELDFNEDEVQRLIFDGKIVPVISLNNVWVNTGLDLMYHSGVIADNEDTPTLIFVSAVDNAHYVRSVLLRVGVAISSPFVITGYLNEYGGTQVIYIRFPVLPAGLYNVPIDFYSPVGERLELWSYFELPGVEDFDQDIQFTIKDVN